MRTVIRPAARSTQGRRSNSCEQGPCTAAFVSVSRSVGDRARQRRRAAHSGRLLLAPGEVLIHGHPWFRLGVMNVMIRNTAGTGISIPIARRQASLCLTMVLPHRIELWTSPYKGCSTLRLRQRKNRTAATAGRTARKVP